MRTVLQILSWIALAGIVVPPVLFLAGVMELDAGSAADAGRSAGFTVKTALLIATGLWFVVTPLWMERE